MTRRRLVGTVLGAAALVTVLTVLARVTGFARNLVLARTVGQTELNGVYTSVNTVPNILYEVVAGGALAALVVPLLARAVAQGDRSYVDRTASALLTWAVVVLTPVAVIVALAAEPIATWMLRDGADPAAVAVGASMLRVFAPQIVLYGVGIVLTGVLQAHRRFGGPALAPLLSSLVVIGAYVTYGVVAPRGTDVDTLDRGPELVLSVGTTLGVVVLSMSLLVPLRRTGLRLRPTLRFPVGVAAHVRALAYAGIAALVAQQVSVLVALLLGNDVSRVTTAVYVQAQTIYLLPWAVLAVPLATAVYPRLAEAWDLDRRGYARQLASATSLTLALMLGAVAATIAAARPLARVVVQGVPGVDSVDPLAAGVVGFAGGLVGYGLFALLSRALYAARAIAVTAAACVGGWITVVVADVVLARVLPADDRVLALALGSTVGMTVLGLALLAAVARHVGATALEGTGRIALVGGIGAALAGWTGHRVASAIESGGALDAVWQGGLAAGVAVVVHATRLVLGAREIVRRDLSALRGGAGAGPETTGPEPDGARPTTADPQPAPGARDER